MQGDQPAFLSAKAIDNIKAREDVEGIVHLPKPENLQRGEHVKITHGPLAGKFGIYEGMSVKDREKVLLDYLGRKTHVLIAMEHLQRAA
jgi:transcription antitermination factor NusG